MVICDARTNVVGVRVGAFGVPGQGKTHGHSVFENDFEDLETDLLAAFVANVVGIWCLVPRSRCVLCT